MEQLHHCQDCEENFEPEEYDTEGEECPGCGSTDTIPFDDFGEGAECPACGANFPAGVFDECPECGYDPDEGEES